MSLFKSYEAIVVGAGHAGVEAAFALANKGHRVALISLSKSRIADMPCNPSIGGPAKGIITREIDALGGMQGLLADQAMIQIKVLNEAKGPAVQALRAQIDKEVYSQKAAQAIDEHPLIDFVEALVESILTEANLVSGVRLNNGAVIKAKAVILTTGTYMASTILRGLERTSAGPDGQQTTAALSACLQSMGFKLQRLKTGTPPRIYADSIDFSQVEQEVIPNVRLNFSARSGVNLTAQVACYLTYTTPETHAIIKTHLTKSTMYSGQIVGVGPRYCPSIEDKVVRFHDKNRHQLFYEPETARGDVIYLQGFSSAMPIEVQKLMIESLPGLAHAKVQKWAYAIEYDAIDPLALTSTLASKAWANLYFAGQLNGTSGYEEAAGQGLIAGINAALMLEAKAPLILRRDEAYLGVLIDDLVTRGTAEPYRMLTSRAEYRLLLRNDNADERLSAYGHQVGLVTAQAYQAVLAKYAAIEKRIDYFANTHLSSNDALAKKYEAFSGPSLLQLLMRPEVVGADIDAEFAYMPELITRVRLAGYVKKQATAAVKLQRLEALKIPTWVDYAAVPNLASEAREKFATIRPLTIGQASRIAGINPADIQMLMLFMERSRAR